MRPRKPKTTPEAEERRRLEAEIARCRAALGRYYSPDLVEYFTARLAHREAELRALPVA